MKSNKKFYFFTFLFIIAHSANLFSQDIISGGANSWIIHTPDDGRTSLYIAPKLNGNWDWAKQTIFYSNGAVSFNNNVGIRTSTPLSALHVESEGVFKGNAWFGKSYINDYRYHFDRARVGVSGTSSTGQYGAGIHFQVRNNNNTNYLHSIIGEDRDGRLIFETGGAGIVAPTEKMTIFPNGNVGIGTTKTNGYKLAVDGIIGTREIVVNTDIWSDFVFNNDYKLKSLAEVEKFIEENKHLPDIPSEKEVKENGVQVGEMNAKLLQKIEELTLYMIDMNKEVKALKNENSELMGKVKKLEAVK
nr:hypothetical protein [uncultured Draconibacterium sp.]